MRPLAELTLYEILDLSTAATPLEIRQAYKTALEVYSEDSAVIYSLFSGDERKDIRARLDEAFTTLIEEKARYAYDQTLIQQGAMKEEEQYWSVRKKPLPTGPSRPEGTASPSEGEKTLGEENPVVKEILSRDPLTGADLRSLRTELGVSLEQIAEWTKIRVGMLRYLEDDQFNELPSRHYLKGFLKAYVQFLHLSPESVVDRYMKRIPE